MPTDEPIEAIAIIDITATAIDHIEDIGMGLRRVVFTTPHPLPSGQIERHVAAKLIIPAACLECLAKKLHEAAIEATAAMLTLVPKSAS